MKRILAVGIIGVTAGMAGCGMASDTDKLAQIVADYACSMHQIVEDMVKDPDQLGLVMQKRKEVQDTLEQELRVAFPEGEEKVTEAYTQVTKEEFRGKVAEKAKAKCNAPEEIIDGAASELEG